MPYPAILIDRRKFLENAQLLRELFARHGKQFHLVSKCFCAFEPLVRILAAEGFHNLADSRMENIYTLERYSANSLLLRLPMLSEVRTVVAHAKMSLNSEYDVIAALSDAALSQQLVHGIVLMIELGDRREGVLPEAAEDLVKRILPLRGVRLLGFGANFNCYGAVIPDAAKLETLGQLASELSARCDLPLEIVSGGNSGSLYLLEAGKLPDTVNHLRIGEGFLLGRETSYGHRVGSLHQDVFTFRAEVIELDRKPSLPDGLQGVNAFGEKPVDEDHGMIPRAILAFGRQDVDPADLTPRLSGLRLLGASSDHALYDISGLNRDLKVGDHLDFALNYSGLLHVFTSPYVHKLLV